MIDNKCKNSLCEIKLEVTHDCLLECIHCSSNAENYSKRSMDWPTCKKVLNEAIDIGVKEIVFSGGEALLWDSIEKAVSLVSKSNIKSTLYTTGNVPDFNHKISALSHVGLSKTCFSLYGATAQKHDEITKVSKSFEKTINAINFCNELHMEPELHFVPLSINFQDLKAIAYLGKAIGVNKISILRFVPQGRGKSNSHFILNKQENLELKKDIVELRANEYEIRVGSPYNFLMLNNSPKCCSGQDRLTISPDFKIYPCDAFKQISSTKLKVENDFRSVKDDLLEDCWKKSSYFKTIRDCIIEGDYGECNQCPMLEKCNSGCLSQKIINNGSFRGPDPLCLLNGLKNRLN